MVGTTQDGVNVFKGVPFAAAPTGSLRWRPPVLPTAWSGDRDASQFGAACPQKTPPAVANVPAKTSEDCLFLNVWAPLRPAEAGLPVMVWIHGGGWRGGAGSDPAFDGAAFAKDGVILVTVNYRLGALGYFAHPALTREAASDAPLGDYGLMDNIAALQWVKHNIAAFGGDPKRVTVFGESAGAGQVLYLLTMPKVAGLFQQAIVESAPAFSLPRSLASAEGAGVELAVSLGLPEGADAAALRALPVDQLVDAPYAPSPFVDGRLVTELPQDAVADGHLAKVPLIIGTNSDEGSLVPYYGEAADAVMGLYGAQTAELAKLYGEDATRPDRRKRLLFADTLFAAPARRIAAHESASAPTFLYRFGYVGEALRGTWLGAQHGSEMIYAFDTLNRAGFKTTPADTAMARTLHACWVGFAKAGRPLCDGAPAWPAYTPARDALMMFAPDRVAPVVGFRKPQFDFVQAAVLDRTAAAK